jgi:pimeloyl-ACP methyl ester carboxylesterase
LAVAAAVVAAASPPASPPAAPVEIVPGVTREMITVPFNAGAKGLYRLEAMLVRQRAPGRYPLAIISHGSPRSGEDRSAFTPTTNTAIAIEFARRGWATLVLMRRGYGESEGPWSEGYGSCNDPDYESAGRASAEDIRAAIRFATDHGPSLASGGVTIDASRVLLVGVSAGGFASVAAAADRLPGLVGVINFAGGRGSQSADEVCKDDRLVMAYATYGRTATPPTVWIYAANDHFFGPALAKRMFAAFQKSGGHGELVMTPAFGTEGHDQFSEAGIPNWRDIVDRFLRANQLPTWTAAIADPPPTLPDPPGLSARGRSEFQRYLASENFDKAFAAGDGGAYSWRTGRRTGEAAAAAALQGCAAVGAHCRVYAADNRLAK